MKTNETAKKTAYMGAGAGLILFGVLGLLPGSFLGGVIGVNLAGNLFGLPLSSALLPRLIVGVFMLLGILVSGIVFITGSTIIGWIVGRVIELAREEKTIPAEVKAAAVERKE